MDTVVKKVHHWNFHVSKDVSCGLTEIGCKFYFCFYKIWGEPARSRELMLNTHSHLSPNAVPRLVRQHCKETKAESRSIQNLRHPGISKITRQKAKEKRASKEQTIEAIAKADPQKPTR